MAEWVFALSAGFVVYVLLAYPALLPLFRGCSRSVPASLDASSKEVSVILPVRNGEAWIAPKLESLRKQDYPLELLQLIVISDGSTDRTDEIAREFREVEVVSIPPSGKATALNEGIARARGHLLFFTDVRQRLDASCIRRLTEAMADPSIGAASGELHIGKSGNKEKESVSLYWRYEKWIRKQHARIDSVLGATGAVYMMRRDLATPMPADTLNDDMFLPLSVFFRGYRIAFVPEAKAFDVPTGIRDEFRRKVRTLAGVYQTIRFFPDLLGPRNRMWLHFASHKLGRLLLPFALLAMLAATPFLEVPWNRFALGGQALLYGMAFADPFVSERTPLKRFTLMARTFVAMMLAALLAASILVRPAQSFWKAPTRPA